MEGLFQLEAYLRDCIGKLISRRDMIHMIGMVVATIDDSLQS